MLRGRRGGRGGVWAPRLVLLVMVGLLTGVGSAVAQDPYEELLAELPEVELGSECWAEEEGDLAAVPGTIVICAPTDDDPDRYWWREASSGEIEGVLYEQLLAQLPVVELGSECTAEEEGDLAAVPGTIVICAPTDDDPDRYWWREASGDEVRPFLGITDRDTEAPVEGTDDADVDDDVLPSTGAWTLFAAGLGLLALTLGGITLRLSRPSGARDIT